MTSLRTQLWGSLLALLTGVGLVMAVSTYWIVRDETNGFFDLQLRQIALDVGDGSAALIAPAADAAPHDPEDDFEVQIWSSSGTPIRRAKSAVELPRRTATGFSDTATGVGAWRSYTLAGPARTVQVSQQRAVRDELVTDAVWRTLIPVAVTIPLSWLLLSLVINSILGRMDVLTQALSGRIPSDTSPLPVAGLPSEVTPLVAALNDLLRRLQGSLAVQKQFVSDAAHELRTPLAALQLQIGNLRKVVTGPEATTRIDELERGLRRATQLSRQLLRQARYDEDDLTPQEVPVDLKELTTSVIADLLPLADDRHQDVGLVRADRATVTGDADDLRILVGNLLENACRYSADGGVIDVAIKAEPHEIALEIQDCGPGIPPDQLELVFQPFHRAAPAGEDGSGLGLSIVARIAARHGAQVTLTNRTDRTGLVARVTWPRHTMVTPS